MTDRRTFLGAGIAASVPGLCDPGPADSDKATLDARMAAAASASIASAKAQIAQQAASDGGNYLAAIRKLTGGSPTTAVLPLEATSRAMLAGFSGMAAGKQAYLSEGLRGGVFVWSPANLSEQVGLDPLQGVFIAPNANGTGASGAWVRQFDGSVNAHWFGARGNASSRDDTGLIPNDGIALQACFDLANHLNRTTHIPGGGYGTSIDLIAHEGQIVHGAGSGWYDTALGITGRDHTILLALPGCNKVIQQESDSVISDLGIDCRYTAHTGYYAAPGAVRSLIRNVRITRAICAYVWDNAQNFTVSHCYGQDNDNLYTLMNGARNGNYYGCSGSNFGYSNPSGLKSDACIFQQLIDVTRPFPYPTSKSVTQNGNDMNRVHGGIFEGADVGIKTRNPHGYTDSGAYGGTLYMLGGCELTVRTVIDTSTLAYSGTIIFENGSFIGGESPAVAPGSGGRAIFEGKGTQFLGRYNLPLRGFAGIANNLLSMLSFDSNEHMDASRYIANGVTLAFDPVTKRLAVTGGSGQQGAYFRLDGPLFSGQEIAIRSTINAVLPVARIGFLIEGLAENETISLVMNGTSGTRFGRRVVASYGNGYTEVFVPMQTGEIGAAFAVGDSAGTPRFRVSNVKMSLV